MSKKLGTNSGPARQHPITWMMLTLTLAFVLGGCSDNATSESADGDGEGQRSDEASPDDGSAASVDQEQQILTGDEDWSPFAEPDIGQSAAGEAVSEDAAGEPTEVILDADPGDGTDVGQAGLGGAESALCATIQIGLDAAADGAEDLVKSQRATLLQKADSLSDRQLERLVSGLADEPLMEVAVLADALDRCVTLGFER